jgi:hypothetical protein
VAVAESRDGRKVSFVLAALCRSLDTHCVAAPNDTEPAPPYGESIMTATAHIEELASRESDGIQVALYWSRDENALSVVVRDNRTGDEFSVAADPGEAMDVFRHPFAYKASRGVASTLAADGEPVATR